MGSLGQVRVPKVDNTIMVGLGSMDFPLKVGE